MQHVLMPDVLKNPSQRNPLDRHRGATSSCRQLHTRCSAAGPHSRWAARTGLGNGTEDGRTGQPLRSSVLRSRWQAQRGGTSEHAGARGRCAPCLSERCGGPRRPCSAGGAAGGLLHRGPRQGWCRQRAGLARWRQPQSHRVDTPQKGGASLRPAVAACSNDARLLQTQTLHLEAVTLSQVCQHSKVSYREGVLRSSTTCHPS